MDKAIFESLDSLFNRFLANLGDWFSKHGFEVLIIIGVAWAIHRFGGQLLARVMETTARPDLYPTKDDRAKRLRTLENLAGDILKISVTIVAVLMIIGELGVDTTPLLASAGALGLVIGIGAQSLVRDIASGFFIIINNQYRVGDEVELRVGGAMVAIEGDVEDIGVRTTALRDLSGNLHHIPNGNILVATNRTIGFSRLNLDIIFPKDVDLVKLKLLIDRVGNTLSKDTSYEKMIQDPPHFVRVIGFEDDGIKIKILGKTGSIHADEVAGEFYNRLIKELRKAKIKLPLG
jgi:moderate conductance mechanosensitive channel